MNIERRSGRASFAWPVALAIFALLAFPCLANAARQPSDLTTSPKRSAPVGPVEIVTVFDNLAAVADLETRWGFAALVRAGKASVLLDTGSDGTVLLSNMVRLGINPRQIDHVVISHLHCDHVGGLVRLLAVNPGLEVHIPVRTSRVCGQALPAEAKVHVTREASPIAPGIQTTGVLGEHVPEQGIVVNTSEGLVVLTGCAHPGILEFLRRVKALHPGQPLALVMGGFHLQSVREDEIVAIVASFRRLGVRRVAPSHCTGTLARARFRAAYGDQFHAGGVGARFVFAATDP